MPASMRTPRRNPLPSVGVAEPGGRYFDGEVSPVQSERAESRLLHRTGWILRDRLPEAGHQFRLEVTRHVCKKMISG